MSKLYTVALIASLAAGCSSCGSGRIKKDINGEPPNGDPNIVVNGTLDVSATSGIAPHGVFFDATVITGLADDDFVNANISWQFGDTSAGQYATTNKDKNLATGFVVGHVFETPGTYTVTATIVDIAGARRQAEPVTITVEEFSGTTRCLSTSGDFTGEPTGCEQETSTDIGASLSWVTAEANRRLLLRRGESWTLSQATEIAGAGPSIVAAFGPSTDPIPRINGTGTNESLTSRTSGLKLMDVEFVNGLVGFSGTDQVAVRLNVHDSPFVGVGIGGDLVFVVDSRVEENDYFSAYIDGSRCSVTGSFIDQMRVATSFIGSPEDSKNHYLAHNIFDASRDQPTTGIKFHARRAVITDNVFVAGVSRIALATDTGDGPTPVDANLGIVLIERNLFRLSFNGENTHNDDWTDVGVAFNTHHHATIRNNLFHNMSRAFVDTSTGNRLSTQHLKIYNNSIYKDKSSGLNHDEGDFLHLVSAPDDMEIFNNVIEVRDVDVNGSAVVKLNGIGTDDLGGLVMDHNMYYRPGRQDYFVWVQGASDPWLSFDEWKQLGPGNGSYFLDPQYVSVDLDSGDFLKLPAASPAVNAGREVVPASEDYFRNDRVVDGRVDIGAIENNG